MVPDIYSVKVDPLGLESFKVDPVGISAEEEIEKIKRGVDNFRRQREQAFTITTEVQGSEVRTSFSMPHNLVNTYGYGANRYNFERAEEEEARMREKQ